MGLYFYESAVAYLVIKIDVFYSDGQGSDVSKRGTPPPPVREKMRIEICKSSSCLPGVP
jgi:hypothetical protein